jgi:phosphoglucomutase
MPQVMHSHIKAGEALNLSSLVAAFWALKPDPLIESQRVSFGTSGHRGCALDATFNEGHVLAITQAICSYRQLRGITGPLFIGVDTHALSAVACAVALEVFAANRVTVMLSANDEFTPTPAVSLAIIAYNRDRSVGLADGIVLTPSHNPPKDGGYKYNACHGGPASKDATDWIQSCANRYFDKRLKDIKRVTYDVALSSDLTHHYDFLGAYVDELNQVVDMELIRASGLRLGVDAMGGAGLRYWAAIAERYRLDLTVLNDQLDPSFSFMPLDWDGQIRMDPSSSFAMQGLVEQRGHFDFSFACDTDHDRHGVVTNSVGLMPPDHYLAACIHYLFEHREEWPSNLAIGKSVVSSRLIELLAKRLKREVFEMPVGFKWFAQGLGKGLLGFCGEESAGSSFLRKNGTVWTTDKDGMTAGLLGAEMTAKLGRDPGSVYEALAIEFGSPVARRIDAAASLSQKKSLASLELKLNSVGDLGGEQVLMIENYASGNGEPIGGIKLSTSNAWFCARPSGTEAIYKIYVESFNGEAHLSRVLEEGKALLSKSTKP